jgi:hypothetical protein
VFGRFMGWLAETWVGQHLLGWLFRGMSKS